MMEGEIKHEGSLSNGNSHQAKRGPGRPRGSLNKKFFPVKVQSLSARPSKKVDYFSPDIVLKKAKKRGRPKKMRLLGRPRKIPLSAEEKCLRLKLLSLKHKKSMSKPLGRPGLAVKRGRGRPPKSSLNVANGTPRKRGRPVGALGKKRSRLLGSTKVTKIAPDGTMRKRGRPPCSVKKVKTERQVDGTPRKRGRPPGSGSVATPKPKVLQLNPDGSPRKRGRPPGTFKKRRVVAGSEGDKKKGRPPGTGKVKAIEERASAQGALRRKRGRPRKISRTDSPLNEEQENADTPLPKHSRTSDNSSQNEEHMRVNENEDVDSSKVNSSSGKDKVKKKKK